MIHEEEMMTIYQTGQDDIPDQTMASSQNTDKTHKKRRTRQDNTNKTRERE
jgi:hypothetical protein